jgi:hypothetical protein
MTISLELAISAIRSGRKEEGRQLLNLLIQQNPNNDKAWLWMSSVVETDEQRARCLYHVLAIDPNSELARRGLQTLGIVVSDSRPVKVPRDSQPIQIPKPTPAQPGTAMLNGPQAAESSNPVYTPAEDPAKAVEERRPFLVDPKAVTIGLPFAPAKPSLAGPIKASPGILNINVEGVKPAGSVQPILSTKTQKMVESPFQLGQLQPGTGQIQETGQSPVNSPGLTSAETAAQEQPGTVQPTPQPAAPGETFTSLPHETRPSQPVAAIYPNPTPNVGLAQSSQPPYYPMPAHPFANHANMTLGMPAGPYLQPPAAAPFPLPGYADPTLGMPMPNSQPPYPVELAPGIHSNSTIGMTPYEQHQLSQMLAFHSNATMMMPTMSEAEARARLLGSPAIPTANAAAMVLQNSATGLGLGNGQAVYAPYSPPADEADDEEEEGGEMNILAVIIFGTLSVTALGGFGMLILLVFISPMG